MAGLTELGNLEIEFAVITVENVCCGCNGPDGFVAVVSPSIAEAAIEADIETRRNDHPTSREHYTVTPVKVSIPLQITPPGSS